MKTYHVLNTLAGAALVLGSFNASAKVSLMHQYDDELDDWIVTALASDERDEASFAVLDVTSIHDTEESFRSESISLEDAYLDQ